MKVMFSLIKECILPSWLFWCCFSGAVDRTDAYSRYLKSFIQNTLFPMRAEPVFVLSDAFVLILFVASNSFCCVKPHLFRKGVGENSRKIKLSVDVQTNCINMSKHLRYWNYILTFSSLSSRYHNCFNSLLTKINFLHLDNIFSKLEFCGYWYTHTVFNKVKNKNICIC